MELSLLVMQGLGIGVAPLGQVAQCTYKNVQSWDSERDNGVRALSLRMSIGKALSWCSMNWAKFSNTWKSSAKTWGMTKMRN